MMSVAGIGGPHHRPRLGGGTGDHGKTKRPASVGRGPCRFSSVAVDEPHFVSALRYVAFNPVRAQLVKCAEDWWSSTCALIAGVDDSLVKVAPALDREGNFAAFLGQDFDEPMTYAALRKAEAVGRPAGLKDWIADMEAQTGKTIAPAK